ncbi:MAG: tripartite tricarboxylate transporter substrate-binding protein [Betaproteobacteria bacterium]
MTRLWLALPLLFAVQVSWAQNWPARPVKILVPFAPGGTADTLGRLAAQKLAEAFKQSFVVEDRPGAGGTIASEMVAKSAPDGYTLVVSGVASHVIAPSLPRGVPYDPVKDFTHIALFGGPPAVLVVHPEVPAKELQELIQLLKANPEKYSYGSPGKDTMPEFDVVEFPGGLLIGARRNAEAGRHCWRITPWIMPSHTIIPPRAGHPLGAHAWVPIDDESCWAWRTNYHPNRDLTEKEVSAMKAGKGIHVQYVPGTFIPLQNKRNDYLIDRESQKRGETFSGVEGIAMQDASLQESMGPIQDRTREHLCPTDRGIVMARRRLLQAAQANREGKPVQALRAEEQRVRSCAIELPREQHFREHARHGLFAAPGTDPVTV